MYGHVGGIVDGARPISTVYVQRRRDGPGFNVWVADMSRLPTAAPWYPNAALDAHAGAPTPVAAIRYASTARFLLGDFEGTGRDDLMVIAPRDGGTAFWLRSTGTRCEAPRLWAQTSSALTPERAQQYVAGGFRRLGPKRRRDRAEARRRHARSVGDREQWTERTPALWLGASGLNGNARLLAAHLADSKATGLVAIQKAESAMSVVQLASTGHAFVMRAQRNTYPEFAPAFAKGRSGQYRRRQHRRSARASALQHASAHSRVVD